jgi:hypothetical protein
MKRTADLIRLHLFFKIRKAGWKIKGGFRVKLGVCAFPLNVARQRLCEYVPAAKNTNAAREELSLRGVFCAVCVVLNIQYVMKGK